MSALVTCSQWARLVQVAVSHNIQWTTVDGLGEPYKIDHAQRVIYLDGDMTMGYDSYIAFARALTKLAHGVALPDGIPDGPSPGG